MTIRLLLVSLILCFVACKSNNADTSIDASQNPKLDTTQVVKEQEQIKNRDVWQHPEYIINLLGDLSQKTVVDLGAGSGYFSFRLLNTAKKLVAVDIDQRFINFMNQKVLELEPNLKSKFEARLGLPDDPKLNQHEADIILIVNTYIYIKNRKDYFTKLKNAMNLGGKLVIVDFKNVDMSIGPPTTIKLSGNQVVQELIAAGYKNIKLDNNALEFQYIVTAEN